jgi:flagellar motor component MotA
MNALLSKKYVISAHTQQKAIRLFKLMGKSVLYAIVINITIMVCITLLMLDDPSVLGSVFSVILLSVVYGGLFNLMLIYPAIYLLEARRNAEEKTVISEKQVINKLLELCYRQGISPEEILKAGEISFKEE